MANDISTQPKQDRWAVYVFSYVHATTQVVVTQVTRTQIATIKVDTTQDATNQVA